MTAAMDARVVGRVYGRPETLVFVADENGLETRVRWNRSTGYKCDQHGTVHEPNGCPHALAASVELRWQRKYERDEAAR